MSINEEADPYRQIDMEVRCTVLDGLLDQGLTGTALAEAYRHALRSALPHQLADLAFVDLQEATEARLPEPTQQFEQRTGLLDRTE